MDFPEVASEGSHATWSHVLGRCAPLAAAHHGQPRARKPWWAGPSDAGGQLATRTRSHHALFRSRHSGDGLQLRAVACEGPRGWRRVPGARCQ
eukprot:7074984-Alexandrium_andersonii.AAC.1